MRNGGRRAHRITLIPIDLNKHDFFLYSSPKAKAAIYFTRSNSYKVIILLISTVKHFLLPPLARLKRLQKVMEYHFQISASYIKRNHTICHQSV